MKISENIKNVPKNLKNVSTENLGKNKELPALGKSQRSLKDNIVCITNFLTQGVIGLNNYMYLISFNGHHLINILS